MKISNLVSVALLGGLSMASVLAADPPAAPRNPGVSMKVPPELDVYQASDPAVLLARATEQRKLADQGDVEAKFQFANSVGLLNITRNNLSAPQKAELDALLRSKHPTYWMDAAAEAGSQKAIRTICDSNIEGEARCAELRAKHPAP